MKRHMILACVVALAVGLATPSAAIVYVLPTDEAMVNRSPLIAYGEIVSVAPGPSGNVPVTDALLRVEELLKGSTPGTTIVVRQLGGVQEDGFAATVMGLPMLRAGDRVLLFLEDNEGTEGDEGVYGTVELALGIFFELSVGGRTLLLREPSFALEVEPPDDPFPDARRRARLPRDAAGFRRWIADRAAGGEPRADYFATALPQRPQRVATPYTVLTAFSCLEGSDNVLRWPNFDRGENLTFTVHGSQPEVPGGGMSEVLAAMNAWNEVSGANVRLAGAASAEEFPVFHGASGTAIGFEDPTSLIPYSYAQGGILAIALMGSTCRRPHTIPGSSVRAHELIGSFIVTQDGFHRYLSSEGEPNDKGKNFEEVIAHELGHALGLMHSCDVGRPCDSLTGDALMRGGVHGSGRGARLNADDENAVKFLYPPPSGGVGPPPSDDPEDPPGCTWVAPYWSGPSGGFVVRPESGRSSVSLECGSRTTEYEAEDGLVVRLVRSRCGGTGLKITGAVPGGWYWQHGDRNAAVAPLLCSESLGGSRAVVPGGVTVRATDTGTWISHDTARLVGIVPHLAGNECSEYVTPYWSGYGGIVARPVADRSGISVRVQCGRTYSTSTFSAGDDGVVAGLLRRSYCKDRDGNPKEGRLTVQGAEPGGWYWISGERNAAVAPLMCAGLLGGAAATVPPGVQFRRTDDGTHFQHDAEKLIGVVPHVPVPP